jgi:hypothetical protein
MLLHSEKELAKVPDPVVSEFVVIERVHYARRGLFRERVWSMDRRVAHYRALPSSLPPTSLSAESRF